MLEIPKEALFLAGKVYLKYEKGKGIKKSPLPDFYIGAHAAVLGLGVHPQTAASGVVCILSSEAYQQDPLCSHLWQLYQAL